jgi:hypothetical protein
MVEPHIVRVQMIFTDIEDVDFTTGSDVKR